MTRRSTWVAALVVVMQTATAADVLILRDGRRIEGTLVNVRGSSIEFEHRGGRDDGRVRRYDRHEVRSIQFDDDDGVDSIQRPAAGLRERTVAVEGRTQWTDTGVDVRASQAVAFVSSGQVRWGPDRRDGAAGERNSPYNQGRPMPNRNAAALIGKVGATGDPFFIGGDQAPIRMRGSGRLFLGINDDYLQDNTGSLRVTIAY